MLIKKVIDISISIYVCLCLKGIKRISLNTYIHIQVHPQQEIQTRNASAVTYLLLQAISQPRSSDCIIFANHTPSFRVNHFQFPLGIYAFITYLH